MSYEFNPENPVFEFPNPYKVENIALFCSGLFVLLAGVGVMFAVRERIAQGMDVRAMAVIGISVGLLIFSIGILARAMTQLRFLFGRNRPESLAPLVGPDQDADSPQAEYYKETLRQNALTYPEPKGALNGLLYSWIPHLIFAPYVIQRAAQTQFYNFLALVATLISFLLCWTMFGQGAASGWIGLIFAAFGARQIMRPMVGRAASQDGRHAGTANVGAGGLIGLIILAVLGPVLLSLGASALPDLGEFSINVALLVALVCAIAGSAVFGVALKNHLLPPPQAIGAARVVDTVTMNAHPNKLVEELDRILMERWFSRIPNRRYTRRSPKITGQQGQFTAEIFEESQPRPHSNRTASGIKHALGAPQFRWLTILTALAAVYILAGTVAATLVVRDILAGAINGSVIALALSQFAVGVFCYRGAHVLWGRFDFVSELIWVDIAGSFESAHVNLGNQLSSQVQTSKNVINIEAMTMRVWVSEIDSVIFAKDAARQLIGMRSLPNMAEELAVALKGFGESRAMVVAPTSNQDMERAQRVGAVHQLVSGVAPSPRPEQGVSSSLLVASSETEALTMEPALGAVGDAAACSDCGAELDSEARFCGECGMKVSV